MHLLRKLNRRISGNVFLRKLRTKLAWFIVLLMIMGFGLKFVYVNYYFDSGLTVGPSNNSSPFQKHIQLLQKEEELYDREFRFEGTFDGKQYVGKTFDKKWNKYLKDLDLYNVKATDDKDVILNANPIIVSAFSSNHYGEAKTLMKFINSTFNQSKILFIYDIGLNDNEKAEIYTYFGKIVHEIRRFPFERYPDYFQHLSQFRWKPILIAKMLLEYPVLWYMDTSIQPQKAVDKVYEDIKKCVKGVTVTFDLCPSYPWQLVEATGHSILSATDPKMFEYLPMPDYFNKNLSMYAGGLELVYGLQRNKEKILRYWVLCALEKDCMGPPGSQVYCNFKANRWAYYGECHRFDQSAINILVSWAASFQEKRYNHPVANDALKVVRGG